MFASFLIAYNRIRSDAEHYEFLNAEIIPLADNKTLNIYLTPFGMVNLRIMQSWDKDEMLLHFNSFVKGLGFNRINEKQRLSELNTAVLLEKDGDFYYHFKPPLYDYSNNFIMEKLHRPHLSSIKIETQASYKQEK